MARRTRTEATSEDTELNMTPMLDVVFILLIFFIVTSKFIKTPGVDISKPIAVTAKSDEPGLMVAVTGDDEIWIDNVPYTLEEVRPVISALHDENPKATAIILGDKKARAGTVMAVQDLLQELRVVTKISTN
ncbi:MAG: biopolymer transporter ExbD [Robiginitomaculum sp.]